jgi:hypothetical protein
MGAKFGRLNEQAFFLFRYLSLGCRGCPEGKNIQQSESHGGSFARGIERFSMPRRGAALGIGKDMKEMEVIRTDTPGTRQDLAARKNNLKS